MKINGYFVAIGLLGIVGGVYGVAAACGLILAVTYIARKLETIETHCASETPTEQPPEELLRYAVKNALRAGIEGKRVSDILKQEYELQRARSQ